MAKSTHKKQTPAKKPAPIKKTTSIKKEKKAAPEKVTNIILIHIDSEEEIKKDIPDTSEAVSLTSDFATPNGKLIQAYPQLTEADFFMYGGEGRDSLLRRIAEKLGVSYEEVVSNE